MESREPLNNPWLILAATVLPLVIYVAQSLALRGWLMDDAGITFVYARNLAEGHGLVSQPGMPHVEGYSNPLWLLVMVPFFWLGLFEPFLTSKIISVLLVAASFYMMLKTAALASGSRLWPGLLATCLLATNASFIIWTSSGLENPLYACLALLLTYRLLVAMGRTTWTKRDALTCAAISIGLALTRPEGILYMLAFPTALLLFTSGSRKLIRDHLFILVRYSAIVVAGLGTFLLFRWLYFGDLFPNTYYVKGGTDLRAVYGLLTMQDIYLSKLSELSTSVFGRHLWLLLPIGLIAWVTVTIMKMDNRRYDFVLLTATLLAWSAFMLLPSDWMGEFRFATPFLALMYLSAAILFSRLLPAGSSRPVRKMFLGVLVLAAFACSVALQFPRFSTWAKQPIVSFAGIAERFGYRYNRWADHLGLDDASLLVPDIGGTLYYSKLRIYDLAGLTDKTIARKRPNNDQFGSDIEAFYAYVFDTLKPTFIHTHGSFTMRSQFDMDQRFSRDYVPIIEYEDEYASTHLKRKIMSGDYIRRDAAETRIRELQEIRDGIVR